jgi:hypothetical protein
MPMHDSRPEPDSLAASAMNRVLESERQAQVTIAECENLCSEQLERARQQRRAILERAQARIVALHTRAANKLEQRTSEAMEKARISAAGADAGLEAPGRRDEALERLVSQLIGTDPPARHDGD